MAGFIPSAGGGSVSKMRVLSDYYPVERDHYNERTVRGPANWGMGIGYANQPDGGSESLHLTELLGEGIEFSNIELYYEDAAPDQIDVSGLDGAGSVVIEWDEKRVVEDADIYASGDGDVEIEFRFQRDGPAVVGSPE